MSANNDGVPPPPPHPSNDTYVSPLYCNSNEGGDGEKYDNSDNLQSDKVFLLREEKKDKRKHRKYKSSRGGITSSNDKGFLQSLPSIILQKRLINLRSILLASSLALILLVFWLLDSLKDPTFAIMVEGNLHKHQPLAKMASVGGTLIIVICMEVISHRREKKKKNHNSNDSSSDILSKEEIESGGGIWTKMDITSSSPAASNDNTYDFHDYDNENDKKIPIGVFRTVGLAYIAAFVFLSYLISLHPEYRSNDIIDDVSDTELKEWKNHSAWYFLGYLQYVTIESYGSIAVATFWSFSNSTLTLKAAKTYYGFIIAIAQVGAIGGSTIATIQNTSIPKLFIVACFGILMQMVVMHVYGNYFPYPMTEDDDIVFFDANDVKDYEEELEQKLAKSRRHRHRHRHLQHHGQSENRKVTKQQQDEVESYSTLKVFLSGVFLIMKHNYLLLILGVSCLYEVSLTCLDYEMKLIGLDRFTAPSDVLGDMNDAYSDSKSTVDAFTIFMGRYGQLTNLLSLLISYYVFPYLMDKHGLKITIRIFPTLLCLVIMTTFVALPMNLPVLFVSMSILKAMTYSINDPAKEILYIPTSNVVKFKAKFWIDVVGARIAKAIGSSINTYAGTAERIVQYGSFPSVVTSVALWIVCYAAGMKFDNLLERGEIVGIEEDEDVNGGGGYNGLDGDVYNDDDVDVDDDYSSASDLFVNPDYTSESGWESNVSVELVQEKR